MKGSFSKVVMVALAVALLAAACAPAAAPTPTPKPTEVLPTAAPAEKVVVKLGVVGPLTGDFSFGGYQQLNGTELAAKEINAKDPTIEFQIIAEDDASICDQSVSAVKKLITQDEVLAVLGAHNSPCTLLCVPVTEEYKTPQYTVSVGTAITQQGSDYIFRVNASAPTQTSELARIAVEQLGYKKIGVLFVNDEYGRSCAEGFKAGLAEYGVEPVVWESWTRGDRDFSGQLAKIQMADPEAVYCPGNLADAALFIQQARQQGLDFVMLGDTGMTGDKLYEWAGDAALGTICVTPWMAEKEDAMSKAFTEAFQAEFDKSPTQHAAQHYDVVYLIYDFIKKEGLGPDLAANRQALRDYTASLTAATAPPALMGGLYFDENGDPLYPMTAVELTEGGVWREVGQ